MSIYFMMINYIFKINNIYDNSNYKLITNFTYLFIVIKSIFIKNNDIIMHFKFYKKRKKNNLIVNDNNYVDGIDLDFSINLSFYDLKLITFFNISLFHNINIYLLYLSDLFFINNFFKKILFFDNFLNEEFYIRSDYFKKKSYELFIKKKSSIFMLNYRFIDHRRYFNIFFKDLTYLTLDKLTLFNLIRQRYGIGKHISSEICKYLGVSNRFETYKLPLTTYYNRLSFFFSNNLDSLDNNLMNYTLNKQSNLIQLKTYKGFRLFKGYPANGQRTRSNHKTAMRKPYKFSFYYI